MSFPRFLVRWLTLACAMLLLAACASQPRWQLNDVAGHMPDLKFQLTNDLGQPITAASYRGKIVMVYFGYTHCPDVCPLTLVHLHTVLQQLGAKAASDIQVLFVTVDPARDTVPVLHQYVNAFDPRFIGATGSVPELNGLVRRYRAIYKIEKPIPANGDYLVTHSSAIYIFGPNGNIRLMATPGSSVDEMVHDLRIMERDGA